MKTLVIGGTGPTGPFVVHGLLKRGHEVVILNRGSHHSSDIPDSVERIIGDPHFEETLRNSLKGRKFDSIFYTKSDKSGDIHKFCNSLVQKMVKENKVDLVNKEVTDLNYEIKKYDKIILCAGVGSKKLAKSIDDFINIYPVKGYSITINNPGFKAPRVSLLDDEKKIVCSRLGNSRLRIAGLAELNGYNLDIIQNNKLN